MPFFLARQQEFEERTTRFSPDGHAVDDPIGRTVVTKTARNSFFFFFLASIKLVFRDVSWHVRHARAQSLLFLPTVVDALVIVQAVERPEHLVTERADRAVQGLKVLLLFVPL